jgi:uncharacterized membrane protein YfcA
MQIYLPIAELSVNIFVLLALGGAAGVLAGMFGVGGGFIMTPLLIFIGVSPAVAVATSANQIIASSVSGFMSHWRRQNVDFKMGNVLLIGGFVGSSLGVALFRWLKNLGQIDLIISLCYVVFLGIVGGLMGIESLRAIMGWKKQTAAATPQQHQPSRLLPMHFARSKITISALLPLATGLFAGMMVSMMGIGGGFLLIPAMIYLLRMPTSVVIGTSLYQIIFITANVTLLQAVTTQTVDIVLALILLSSSVVGAQIGGKLGAKLPAEHLRGLMALLVLTVALRLAWGLFLPPDNPFTVTAE